MAADSNSQDYGSAENDDSSHHRAPRSTTTSSSDENEPLINHRHGGGGRDYVAPDDPIVSPLNLYKIKLLRYALLGVLCFNTLLFLGYFISDFVSIPGFNNRGRSFLELDLVLLNIFTDVLTLWCFIVPAYYERVIGYVSFALVAIDFVVVFTVPTMRDQLGLMGNFLFLWTLANLLINSLADYWVEESKKQQEIRYTGRIETRRSLFELSVMSIKVFSKLVLLLIFFNISLSVWLTTFDTHEKPWGEMVSVNEGGFNVHLACYGDVHDKSVFETEGSGGKDDDKDKQPILLLEGGQSTSAEEFQEWVQELYHLNKIQRYCIWDRPGYGFSDSAPSPISIGIITEYLIEALKDQNVEGPFSVIGFDSGGLYSRMFASRNPGKIHSMLLVDSWHEDLLKHNPFSGSNRKNEKRSTFRNILEFTDTRTGIKLWFKGVISPLGIVPNFHWFFHPRKHSSNNRIFGHDMRHRSKYLRARLQEQVTASILSYNEVLGSDIHDVPLSVISSDFMIKNSLNWGKWQRELTKLSDNSIEWVVAENSNHRIWESPKGRAQLQQLLLRLVSEKSNY